MTNLTRIALVSSGPSLSAEERAEAAGFERGTWGFQGFVDARNGIPARKFTITASDEARSEYRMGYKAGEAS